MAQEQDSGSRSARFAPRERSDAESRQPFRTSLIFVGIALVLSFVTVLWLGLFNERDEIRLEVTDIKVDETGDVELTGAVYRGQTTRGEPYEIVADTARERDTGQVDLSLGLGALDHVQALNSNRSGVNGPWGMIPRNSQQRLQLCLL